MHFKEAKDRQSAVSFQIGSFEIFLSICVIVALLAAEAVAWWWRKVRDIWCWKFTLEKSLVLEIPARENCT